MGLGALEAQGDFRGFSGVTLAQFEGPGLGVVQAEGGNAIAVPVTGNGNRLSDSTSCPVAARGNCAMVWSTLVTKRGKLYSEVENGD